VDKFINELRAQLVEKGVTVELTEAARAWLANHGFDKQFGARPMARLIQSKIRQPLAEELLFGTMAAGWSVTIDVEGDGIALKYEPSQVVA
jgi:ATP-dependent Clp protease ATP-binding subunit ClpA